MGKESTQLQREATGPLKWYHSIRLKIIMGFAFVIIPIVAFLFYNNMYSIRIVREQVSQNYDNLLQQYVQNMDQMLDETRSYMFRFIIDPDLTTLYAFGNESDEYYLTKIRIMSKLTSGIGYFNVTSSIFVYSPVYKELLLASSEDHNSQTREIGAHVDELARNGDGRWNLVETSDGYAMAMVAVVSSELVAGVWVHPEKLISQLRNWNLGPGGDVAVMDSAHSQLNHSRIGEEIWDKYSEKDPGQIGNYLLIDAPSLDQKMLLVKADSNATGLRFMLAIPEATILRGLPFFQKAIYIVPFGVLLVLFFYFTLLQQILIGPLYALIRGMRRIGQGMFDTRLQTKRRGEFAYLITVFNDMADQIRSLKINVYEEKLRVQQAEYKHLQVQINPHFYMNSLNIMYNLAVLRDYQTLKKMALYLADYFRFTIHSNRALITLEEELKHISNYMEIQCLRYPDNLTYDIFLPEELRGVELPPLTIQPFTENAILHGFKNRNRAFHLTVTVEADPESGGSGLLVTIRDTGVGFVPEWLQEFENRDWSEGHGGHVGIWNVIRRLTIHYGAEASVQLSNTDTGAQVLIRLPTVPGNREGESGHV